MKTSHTLVALVPVASGVCGWTGADTPQGDTLTTTSADVAGALVALGYARREGDAPASNTVTSPVSPAVATPAAATPAVAAGATAPASTPPAAPAPLTA